MIVKTKKYQLPKRTYVEASLLLLLRKQWWYIFGPLALAALSFIWPREMWWFIITAFLITLFYALFRVLQYYGVTQLPQNQIMFDKLWYEIDSRQVLIRVDEKRGSPVSWDMIKTAYSNKDHFLFLMGPAQFIYLPHSIFKSDNEIRFLETILVRKNYITEAKIAAKPAATAPVEASKKK